MAQAANPDLSGRNAPAFYSARPLFGLAPGGVCHAGTVTRAPVRSCRTLSPLPVRFRRHRRYTLCGTFPRLPPDQVRRSPGGRYPPPLFRGARTFLGLAPATAWPPDRPHIVMGPALGKPCQDYSPSPPIPASDSSGESMNRQMKAPSPAPRIGATQKSHSCGTAPAVSA